MNAVVSVRGGTAQLRIKSRPGSTFSAEKPIFRCWARSIYWLQDKFYTSPNGFPYSEMSESDSKKRTEIEASLDGRNPIYFFGDRMSKDGKKKINDTWFIRSVFCQ